MILDRRRLLACAGALGFAAAAPANVRAQEPRARIRIGVARLISFGPIFIAAARKFFDQVNLDVEFSAFPEGTTAMSALVAGELDLTASSLNAGIFNTVARGAPFKLVLDCGIEKSGFGSMSIIASNAMVDAGYKVGKGAMLKGKRIAIPAPGSIDQYLLGREAEQAGLDPRADLQWLSGMPYPEMVRLMGAGHADVANIPVPLAFLAEDDKIGKIVGAAADIEPDTQLACWAMSTRFLSANRSAAVRFAMVHIHAGRLFMLAAAGKDPEVVKLLAEATKLPEPLIARAAPRWAWYDEDGMPNVASVLAQVEFLSRSMRLVTGKVTEEMLFDLSPAKEAARRLKSDNPFT
jgi:NitT/TauT family transport system substrate-binding protein